MCGINDLTDEQLKDLIFNHISNLAGKFNLKEEQVLNVMGSIVISMMIVSKVDSIEWCGKTLNLVECAL